MDTKIRADKKYYNNHKEKWLTDEKLRRSVCSKIARKTIRNTARPYVCVECAADSVKLDTHHIDFDYENNDPSNLEYRCKKCHNRIHGKIPWTAPTTDTRRKVQYTEDEIISCLKQAADEIGYIPFSQTNYIKLCISSLTVRTILKRKTWKEWMELISK